jgi:hypothetical protein
MSGDVDVAIRISLVQEERLTTEELFTTKDTKDTKRQGPA